MNSLEWLEWKIFSPLCLYWNCFFTAWISGKIFNGTFKAILCCQLRRSFTEFHFNYWNQIAIFKALIWFCRHFSYSSYFFLYFYLFFSSTFITLFKFLSLALFIFPLFVIKDIFVCLYFILRKGKHSMRFKAYSTFEIETWESKGKHGASKKKKLIKIGTIKIRKQIENNLIKYIAKSNKIGNILSLNSINSQCLREIDVNNHFPTDVVILFGWKKEKEASEWDKCVR